jgi:hypothetical protein
LIEKDDAPFLGVKIASMIRVYASTRPTVKKNDG